MVKRQEYWRSVRKIGGGAYGSVWLEKSVQGQRDIERRAVKKVSLRPLRNGKQVDVSRELEAIAKFSHDKYADCFVKSFGWYQKEQDLFIAMEYLEDGDLEKYLSMSSPFLEKAAGDITYQILEGLSYMHKNRFAHRDLKPGNILIKSCPPRQWWVKIGDFGISKRCEDEVAKSTLLQGTLGFIAPELHGLTSMGTPFAADMWSLGEITFQLMTKQPVFENIGGLVEYVTQNQTFPSEHLLSHNISSSGQDFILLSVTPTPEKRITVEAALKHQWIAPYQPSAIQSPVSQINDIESEIKSITENLASWNSITPSSSLQNDLPTTVRPQRSGYRQLSTDHNLRPAAMENYLGQARMLRRVTYHLGEFKGHTNSVHDVAFSPDGTTIVSVSQDRTVRTWDAVTGRQMLKLKGHRCGINSVAFSPDGTTIVSGSQDKTVRTWDAATGEQLQEFKGHTNDVNDVAFSPDSTTIVSGSHDRTVRTWDTATGRQLQELKGHTGWVQTVVFSPHGTTIASESDDSTVRIWDAATGGKLQEFQGYSGWVYGVAFSPDGSTIVSGSCDRTVRIWDIATGGQLQDFRGHTGWIGSVAFSPDGTTVVSGSSDWTIRTWKVAIGRQLEKPQSTTGGFRGVAFSPDGTILALGSNGQVLSVRQLHT